MCYLRIESSYAKIFVIKSLVAFLKVVIFAYQFRIEGGHRNLNYRL
nr:MAG TPA: hypothetical protein [Caudoviricetes sp.]